MPGATSFVGAVARGRTIYAWGEGLWRYPGPKALARATRFREAGASLDAGGRAGLVLNERDPAALAWYDGETGERRLIDAGVVAHDAAAATLYGRRGVLVTHHGIQVRFYEAPTAPDGGWAVRDIYSFYSHSRQGGLALGDPDGDGRGDIFCGNYWIRGPESFEQPWRLFAIDTWNETEESALLKLVWNGRALFAAQSAVRPARAAWLRPPRDVRQLWTQHDIDLGGEPVTSAFADRSGSVMAVAGGRLFRIGEDGRKPVVHALGVRLAGPGFFLSNRGVHVL